MTTRQRALFLLPAVPLMLMLSCTSLRRYSSAEILGTDNSLADIDLFGYRLSDSRVEKTSMSLWDLSADAQSQYIKILNARFPGNEEFISAMNLEYLAKENEEPSDDRLTRDMRFVFSVSKRRGYGGRSEVSGARLSPADRIEYLKISLTLPDKKGVKFKSWNHFSTEYGTIDIGGVSFSRSLDMNVSGSNSSEGKINTTELSASGRTALSRKEDQLVRYRYLLLNGRIKNNLLEVEEEGTREIDLTGNLLADVSIEFEGRPVIISAIKDLQDSTGSFNTAEKIHLINNELLVPLTYNIPDTIYAELRMDYVFRNVTGGQRTYQEWDDRVNYYSGSISKNIRLLSSCDYLPEFYTIGEPGQNGKEKIIMFSSEKKDLPLVFGSKTEAEAFRNWLMIYFSRPENISKTLELSGYSFLIGNKVLNGAACNSVTEMKVIPYFKIADHD